MLDKERNANMTGDPVGETAANDNTDREDGGCNIQGGADLSAGKPATETESDVQPRAANNNASGIDDESDEASYTLPDDVYPAFFPPWALEETLQAKIYCALYDEVVLAIQPQDIFDEMDAVEITDDFWRSRQISDSIDSIIKAARPDALASILAPMAGHDFGLASRWSQGYFCGNANQRKAVEDMLRGHGMDAEVITAQAFMQRSPVVQILTRVTIALGIHRQDILAAHAKRREARKAKSSKRRRVAA